MYYIIVIIISAKVAPEYLFRLYTNPHKSSSGLLIIVLVVHHLNILWVCRSPLLRMLCMDSFMRDIFMPFRSPISNLFEDCHLLGCGAV
jgi:hypothetical protein